MAYKDDSLAAIERVYQLEHELEESRAIAIDMTKQRDELLGKSRTKEEFAATRQLGRTIGELHGKIAELQQAIESKDVEIDGLTRRIKHDLENYHGRPLVVPERARPLKCSSCHSRSGQHGLIALFLFCVTIIIGVILK